MLKVYYLNGKQQELVKDGRCLHEGCWDLRVTSEQIYGETHMNAYLDPFENKFFKALPHSWCPINAFVLMEELTVGTQYMSTNGDNINGLEIHWGGVRREHLLVQHYFSLLLPHISYYP